MPNTSTVVLGKFGNLCGLVVGHRQALYILTRLGQLRARGDLSQRTDISQSDTDISQTLHVQVDQLDYMISALADST
jgi:hypothetical protein